MEILQVVTDTDRRGAQVFASDVGAALCARGHAVTTVALAPGRASDAPLDVEVIGRGVRDVSTLRNLRARMARADVTVAHGASTGPACAIAGGGRSRPFVYRQISDSRFWAPTRPRRMRVRLALSRARCVIALSEFNRRELVKWIGVHDDRIRVVPNGVPAARFTVADDANRSAARSMLRVSHQATIAFVGALVPEKGADRAIEHVAALPSHVQLVIAGDGPERAALETLAAARAPGRVHFLGSVADVVAVYHAADVVTLPTRGGDAMPATLIEAGLCGIPVVATGIGAIPEVVVDGETGVVIPPDRTVEFPAALGALVDDRDRRARLGAAARARSLARYAIDPVADAYETVLRDAMTR